MHFFLEHWRSFFEMVWHNQPVLEHQNGIYFPSSLHPENEPQVHLAKDIRFSMVFSLTILVAAEQ